MGSPWVGGLIASSFACQYFGAKQYRSPVMLSIQADWRAAEQNSCLAQSKEKSAK